MQRWSQDRMEKRAYELSKGVVPVDLEAVAASLDAFIHIEKLEEDVSGMLITSSKTQKKIILINKSHHANRRRFTAAHEIAHLVLHPDQKEVFIDSRGSATMYFRSEKSIESLPDAERQANDFAACLLMPKKSLEIYLGNNPIDLNDDMAVKIMANKFSVSIQALSIRLAKLNLSH